MWRSLMTASLVTLALGYSNVTAAEDYSPYKLRPEWQGPCKRAKVIDVNLGNSPEAFVDAASCQIGGATLYPESRNGWIERLKTEASVRRVDVVHEICAHVGRKSCEVRYSDPWQTYPQPDVTACEKRFNRDIGAVVMFFFHCPHGTNCEMNWAADHVHGMETPAPELGGYYTADQAGFWRYELRNAKAAGLQFILPNFYGPDMQSGQIDTLAAALGGGDGAVKVGLFDDSWAWGHAKFGKPWADASDLSDIEKSAKILYENKWKPYFLKVPKEAWYRIGGRPLIYFYNAGTLKPANRAAAVIARMKAMFAADFGVEPFVAVDDAFFADPGMTKVADSRFRWDTLAGDFHSPDGMLSVDNRLSQSQMSGRMMANGFVRWDSHNRDHRDKPGDQIAIFDDRTIKGDELLQSVLDRTQGADNLLLQTFNDLGEGTGVDLAYDYYAKGAWLRPDHFLRQIRAANCQN